MGHNVPSTKLFVTQLFQSLNSTTQGGARLQNTAHVPWPFFHSTTIITTHCVT